ncbi:MAG: HAMP domain-containing sensor histidine kinase [Verrucomicrobiota bacterium]
MRVRPVIFAWWLLLAATVLMAAAAWWLLGREADRVESLAAGTLANRTATVADSIDLLMEEVRGGVADGLLSVRDVREPRFALAEMVESNPYVSVGYYFRGGDSVTVWLGKQGELPRPGAILQAGASGAIEYPWTLPEFSTNDSEAFAQTFTADLESQSLAQSKAPSDAYDYFSENTGVEDDPADFYSSKQGAQLAQQQILITKNVALKQQRDRVRQVNTDNLQIEGQLTPDGSQVSVTQSMSGVLKNPLRRGWISYDLDDEEQWMAWTNVPDGGDDYIGVWLDREVVVAELSKAINLSQQDGMRFRLVDPEGRIVGEDYSPLYKSAVSIPELTLAVGSALPLWHIETFRANGANTFGASFRYVGGLFIGGLSATILIGSAVLIWQAQRDARDAQQKTTFVANVSHELKTPLTSIRLFADMLYDGRVKDSDKQREYLQRMINETQRLGRLVNNVLDFSRLERGQRRLKSEEIDLGQTVEEIINSQSERLSLEGLNVSYVAPESACRAKVDRDALEQVLLNLLDNAAKYAASGERAEVVLRTDTGGWSLQVNDFGPGIFASERKHVFAPFHRSDDRLTSERPGCGLGLSIAARLAEEIGGSLVLEDNVPNGCSFILRVPA